MTTSRATAPELEPDVLGPTHREGRRGARGDSSGWLRPAVFGVIGASIG